MFYVKNVPTWERIARIVIPICPAILGVQYFGFGAAGIAIVVSAVGIALTGVVGFCPMCAMVGRKLDQKAKAQKV